MEFFYDLDHHHVLTALNTSWYSGEVYAGGWHLASYANSDTYFIHADWLGTVRARTDHAGTVYGSYTSLPFGDCLSSSGGCPSTFPIGALPSQVTDQDRDSETGLDHFMFRQYSSVQGRWMRPDPAGMGAVDFGNPQTWNRYAYVAGNPTGAVDPLGLRMNLACPAGFCGYGGGEEPSCLSCGGGLNPALGPGQILVDGIARDSSFADLVLQTHGGVICTTCGSGSNNRAILGANGSVIIQQHTWVASYTTSYGYNPDTGYVNIVQTPAHWSWQNVSVTSGSSGTLPNGDVPVRMDFLRNSADCPNCGDMIRNVDGAAKAAFVATGAVVALPAAVEAAATAAPYVPGILNTGVRLVGNLYYNPATWAAAVDIIKVLTPPVSLPTTWPGFGVCVAVRCWEP